MSNAFNSRSNFNKMNELFNRMVVENTNNTKTNSLEWFKTAPDGNTYGIIKEYNKYYIKISDGKGTIIKENFNFINGDASKPKWSFNSYSEAMKKINIIFSDIVITNKIKINEDINLLDDDSVDEETKFKLKVKGDTQTPVAPSPVTPSPEEESNIPSEEPTVDSDTDTPIEDSKPTDDNSNDDVDEKDLQKATGKLAQLIRDTNDEDIDDKLIKYIMNSVTSALPLEKVSDEDKKDMINKIEDNDDEEENEDSLDSKEVDISNYKEEPEEVSVDADNKDIANKESKSVNESFIIKKIDIQKKINN